MGLVTAFFVPTPPLLIKKIVRVLVRQLLDFHISVSLGWDILGDGILWHPIESLLRCMTSKSMKGGLESLRVLGRPPESTQLGSSRHLGAPDVAMIATTFDASVCFALVPKVLR